MQKDPEYEVFAIRYATRDARRSDHFIGGDPHDGPMPMDYFVWLIRGAERSVIVDTGFTAEVAAARRRKFLRCPVDALQSFDIDPDDIADVVLTHMHYDHVGNFRRFSRAQFHLQEPELHFAVGRHMRREFLARSFEVEDVVGIVRLNYARRVRLYNGPVLLAPGIGLHPAPGHSAGLQFVTVNTRRGAVVLASDVTHFYENLETGRPFTTVLDVGGMLDSFDRLIDVAPSPAHIVPGHDPKVMRHYPPARPGLEGIAVRLDADPG